jgi:hypothetical protein
MCVAGLVGSRELAEFSHQTSSIFRGKLARFAPTWAAEDMKTVQSKPNDVLPPCSRTTIRLLYLRHTGGALGTAGWGPLRVTHPTPVGQLDLWPEGHHREEDRQTVERRKPEPSHCLGRHRSIPGGRRASMPATGVAPACPARRVTRAMLTTGWICREQVSGRISTIRGRGTDGGPLVSQARAPDCHARWHEARDAR